MKFSRALAVTVLTFTLSPGATCLPAVANPVSASNVTASEQGWSVSVGDSYISGEGGRWAGNSSSASQVDALGANAYNDAGSSESIERCHRSTTAEITYAAKALNLACSGSRIETFTNSSGNFKPGLDFFDDGQGKIGQALALQQFASKNKVSVVAVQLGGNDFNFADVVTTCVKKFLLSSSANPSYCKDDSATAANFTTQNSQAISQRLALAFKNVHKAMSQAGYADSSYRIVVQNYPQPLPTSATIAYGQSGYSRQSTYGCGFWNADLDWAASKMLPTVNGAVYSAYQAANLTNASFMDILALFAGKELCAQGTKKLNDTKLSSWKSAGASDVSEWFNEIRTVSTAFSDYYIQESLHPNYWGQRALRGCLRQMAALNSGAVKKTCSQAGTGLNSQGEAPVRIS